MTSPKPLIAIAVLFLGGCAGESIEYSGSDLFAANCASCHGIYGDGTGPANAAIGQTVPDLRQIASQNDGRFPRDLIRRIVDGREIIAAHSSDVMPKWGFEFEASEGYSGGAEERVASKIEALVDYLESIQLKD